MSEPEWTRQMIWWRLYPLGFTGAFPEPPTGPAAPHEHRLLRIVPWLDHVAELGASGIALGPVFASSSHGYDTVDHFRLDPRLGEDGDFDELVEQTRRRGLRLQLDGVFNHVGREHRLVTDALAQGPDGEAARLLRTAPSGGFVLFEGHDSLITLNHDHPDVRSLVAQVMTHWLDRGADAWRLDAAYAVPTAFWAAVLGEVRRTHPQAWFEAEVIHGDYVEFVEQSTADTVTQYELWKAIWSSINDRNLFELGWALQRHNEMLATFAPATFIGNHDVTRIASRIEDRRHVDHAVVLLAVLGGTPTVYAGDEYGMTGVKEDRLGGDDAVRPTFPPDPPAPETLAEHDGSLLGLYQRLLRLRRAHPWLHRATSDAPVLRNEHASFVLSSDAAALTVTLNLSDHPLPLEESGAGAELLDQDDASWHSPGLIAAHGWCISRHTE